MAKDMCEVISVDKDKIEKLQKAIPGDDLSHRMADIFKVLADPTRIKIVSALELEELCVCDIAALASLDQSLVSHHLRTMRHMDIVRYRRDGKMAFYSISDNHIRAMLAVARDHSREK